MTTIRPNPFPQGQTHQNGGTAQDPAKAAAARAFFAAAMGQAQAAQAPAVTATAAAPAPAPAARTAPPSGEAPTRILRPGSLIDIRV